MKLTGSDLTCRALDFAIKAHDRQYRADGKTPYIEHPLEVARLFRSHWETDVSWLDWTNRFYPDKDAAMYRGIALCEVHDSIENGGATFEDLRAAGLGDLEDELNLLTRGSEQSYLSYLLAIKGYMHISVLPYLVKLADIETNEKDLVNLPLARRKWAATKYEMARWILAQP